MFSSWFLSNWETLAFEVISSTQCVALFNLGVTPGRRKHPYFPGALEHVLRALFSGHRRAYQAQLTSVTPVFVQFQERVNATYKKYQGLLSTWVAKPPTKPDRLTLQDFSYHWNNITRRFVWWTLFSLYLSAQLLNLLPGFGVLPTTRALVKGKVYLPCFQPPLQATASYYFKSHESWWHQDEGQWRNHPGRSNWSDWNISLLAPTLSDQYGRVVRPFLASGPQWLQW